MNGDWFLILAGFVYIAIASYQDLRKREVWNWLNFSLIIFALSYRAFYAVLVGNLMFFVYGLLGFLAFVGLAYLFYYARIFAGGDAKLLMGLGAVLTLSDSLTGNLFLGGMFIFLLLFFGGLWGIAYSIILAINNKKKFLIEFKKQFKKNKKMSYTSIIVALIFICLPILLRDWIFVVFPVLILAFPILYIYGKAVEESCMIIQIETSQLTEGDWLYEPVKVGKKTIRPYWEGLSSKELEMLKKHKGKVKVKAGIPFVPAFFIAFLAWVYVRNSI